MDPILQRGPGPEPPSHQEWGAMWAPGPYPPLWGPQPQTGMPAFLPAHDVPKGPRMEPPA